MVDGLLRAFFPGLWLAETDFTALDKLSTEYVSDEPRMASRILTYTNSLLYQELVRSNNGEARWAEVEPDWLCRTSHATLHRG